MYVAHHNHLANPDRETSLLSRASESLTFPLSLFFGKARQSKAKQSKAAARKLKADESREEVVQPTARRVFRAKRGGGGAGVGVGGGGNLPTKQMSNTSTSSRAATPATTAAAESSPAAAPSNTAAPQSDKQQVARPRRKPADDLRNNQRWQQQQQQQQQEPHRPRSRATISTDASTTVGDMGSSSHENIPTTKPTPAKDNANVVYTPASTVSSKADSAYEGEDTMASSEPVADNDNNDAASAGWREWWKAEELAAQVGSLSEKLTELKDVIITNRNTNPDVEANV
jgi:hypothetical protein